MDGRNGLLTLAAYVTAALLVVLIACWGIFRYGVDDRVSSIPFPNQPPPEVGTRHVELATKISRQDSEPNESAQRRIRLLESMLAAKSEKLREQSQVLSEKTTQYEELRDRYDEVVAMAVGYLEQGAEDPANADEELTDEDTEVARLEAELNMARAVYETAVVDLESLQDELAETFAELEQLKETTDRTSTDRLRDELVLESAAIRVLVAVGESSVPALRQALNHEDPIVRRWAAAMLGGLGFDATDAVDDLTEALSDSDPNVRSAARAALEAIGR